MGGFNAISLKLKEMYQMITLGGDAELELVDSLDPFSEARIPSARLISELFPFFLIWSPLELMFGVLPLCYMGSAHQILTQVVYIAVFCAGKRV